MRARSAAILPFGTLLVAFCVYLIIQVGYLQLSAMSQRVLPVEPDDAYSYIVWGPLTLECAQNCPAISDLRTQIDPRFPATDHQWMRARQYSRLMGNITRCIRGCSSVCTRRD